MYIFTFPENRKIFNYQAMITKIYFPILFTAVNTYIALRHYSKLYNFFLNNWIDFFIYIFSYRIFTMKILKYGKT